MIKTNNEIKHALSEGLNTTQINKESFELLAKDLYKKANIDFVGITWVKNPHESCENIYLKDFITSDDRRLFRQIYTVSALILAGLVFMTSVGTGVFVSLLLLVFSTVIPLNNNPMSRRINIYDTLRKETLCWFKSDGSIVACENPVEIYLDEQGRLHNANGMSIKFSDGWGMWHINGVMTDEQVVLHPESQTLEQITRERNLELRSIRISRIGWESYLKQVGKECIDYFENHIEGTIESLVKTKMNEVVLVCTCPTGRIFYLKVDSKVKTCKEARDWLAGENPFFVLGRS